MQDCDVLGVLVVTTVYQEGHCSWKRGSKREAEGNEAEKVVKGQM